MNNDTDKIIFEGDPQNRESAITYINQQLSIHGEMGSAFGNYSAGLLAVAGLSTVTVVEHDDRYDISSYTSTHDLSFSIDRQSGAIDHGRVGTTAPMPIFSDSDISPIAITAEDNQENGGDSWDSGSAPLIIPPQ